MKIALYSVTYAGIWYKGEALSFEEYVKRAKAAGYDGIELDGKRPHGNPMDLDAAARKRMRALLDSEGRRSRAWRRITTSPARSQSIASARC